MRDWKTRDQITGVGNAGLENEGPNRRVENAGVENAGPNLQGWNAK